MKVLYLHGLGAKPGGYKPTYLVERGFEVVNPALPDDDFAESVQIAQWAYDKSQPAVVVGSSRGGAVAMALETGRTPVVLIAPAWRRWGTAQTVKPETTVLHSQFDALVPLIDSQQLVAASGLPPEALCVVGAEHRMTCPEAMNALVEAIRTAAESE